MPATAATDLRLGAVELAILERGHRMSALVEIEDAFRRVMLEHGLDTDEAVVADGQLHRIHITGDKRGSANGWYKLHANGVAAGAFGCWKRGITCTWNSGQHDSLTPRERRRLTSDIAAARRQRQIEKERRHDTVARLAQRIWSCAGPALKHPYLTRKGVQAHAIRWSGAALLIPMFDADGELWSLQRIQPDGSKRYLKGGRVQGCHHVIGKRWSRRVWFAEGYATAASVYEHYHESVVICFSAGNMVHVARALKGQLADRSIAIMADDDDAGIKGAQDARSEIGGAIFLPRTRELSEKLGRPLSDFNDVVTALR